MRTKNALLIIDAQNDFCRPDGSLFVPGAVEDIARLNRFITENQEEIDYICATLDTHPVHDIAHPSFWSDADGNSPAPFTQITLAEVKAGKWKPNFEPSKAISYLEKLEAQGEFPHFIWTFHCLAGTEGASLESSLAETLINWTKTGRNYETQIKGTYPFSEHFGIFTAQIPDPEHPETQLNTKLLDQLNRYENVYLAGQAKSHCVATSLKQMMLYKPELAQKVIILQDCMSDVPNLGYLGEPIYQEARQKGIRFTTSAEKIKP